MDLAQLLKLTSPVRKVTIENQAAYVTSMDGTNREYVQELWGRKKSPMTYVVAVCLCDVHGTRYDPQGRQRGEVAKIPSRFLEALFEAAMNASGLGEEEPDPDPTEGNG